MPLLSGKLFCSSVPASNVVGKEDTAADDAVHAELAEHFTLAVKRLQAVSLAQFMGEHKVGSHCASTVMF